MNVITPFVTLTAVPEGQHSFGPAVLHLLAYLLDDVAFPLEAERLPWVRSCT
jgi:hypothetical protein